MSLQEVNKTNSEPFYILFPETGQDDDARTRAAFDDFRRGLETVHFRHDQIQQDDIRLRTSRQFHSLDSIRCLTSDFNEQSGYILQFQKRPQAPAYYGMVVHHKHPDFLSTQVVL